MVQPLRGTKKAAGYRKEARCSHEDLGDPPDGARNALLPRHAREIYEEAYDSADDRYGEESRAHRVAWSAVENEYQKNEQGGWVEEKD